MFTCNQERFLASHTAALQALFKTGCGANIHASRLSIIVVDQLADVPLGNQVGRDDRRDYLNLQNALDLMHLHVTTFVCWNVYMLACKHVIMSACLHADNLAIRSWFNEWLTHPPAMIDCSMD